MEGLTTQDFEYIFSAYLIVLALALAIIKVNDK